MAIDLSDSPGSGAVPQAGSGEPACQCGGGTGAGSPHHAGRRDWAAVAALAASLTALAALGTAVAVFWEVRQSVERLTFTVGLDTLARFTSEWNAEDMTARRSAAASALLDGRATRDLDQVFGFFEQIALLASRGTLDQEMIWYDFYWPMANYWSAGREYVETIRRSDPNAWERVQALVAELAHFEAHRKRRLLAEAAPTAAQIREFLKDEAAQAACEQDDQFADARRLPL